MTDFDRRFLQYLLNYVTPQRQQRFAEVLSRRTRRITVVLEDIYGSHNIAAVVRSCDAFGVQDVHIIEDHHDFRLEPVVSLGSQKWLTVHRYRDADSPRQACVARLRQDGYRLLAVTPHADAQPPENVDVGQPCALLFGAEKEGLTSEIAEMADAAVRIPMCGFVESLNVSVAAALCLYPMTNRLRSEHEEWELSEDEQESLLLEWARKTVPRVDALEARFRRDLGDHAVDVTAQPPAAVDR